MHSKYQNWLNEQKCEGQIILPPCKVSMSHSSLCTASLVWAESTRVSGLAEEEGMSAALPALEGAVKQLTTEQGAAGQGKYPAVAPQVVVAG